MRAIRSHWLTALLHFEGLIVFSLGDMEHDNELLIINKKSGMSDMWLAYNFDNMCKCKLHSDNMFMYSYREI